MRYSKALETVSNNNAGEPLWDTLVRSLGVTVLGGTVGADGGPTQADMGRRGQVGAWAWEGGQACDGLKTPGSRKWACQDSLCLLWDLGTGLGSLSGWPAFPTFETLLVTPNM